MPINSRKVIVSIRADLVDLIDRYLDDHKKESLNRSAVVEKALLLWKQQIQENEDEFYFRKNMAKLNIDVFI